MKLTVGWMYISLLLNKGCFPTLPLHMSQVLNLLIQGSTVHYEIAKIVDTFVIVYGSIRKSRTTWRKLSLVLPHLWIGLSNIPISSPILRTISIHLDGQINTQNEESSIFCLSATCSPPGSLWTTIMTQHGSSGTKVLPQTGTSKTRVIPRQSTL